MSLEWQIQTDVCIAIMDFSSMIDLIWEDESEKVLQDLTKIYYSFLSISNMWK